MYLLCNYAMLPSNPAIAAAYQGGMARSVRNSREHLMGAVQVNMQKSIIGRSRNSRSCGALQARWEIPRHSSGSRGFAVIFASYCKQRISSSTYRLVTVYSYLFVVYVI